MMSMLTVDQVNIRLRKVVSELREIRDRTFFSKRLRIARAITAIGGITGDLPSKRETDAPVCGCGRAEFVTITGTGERFLCYEQDGQNVLGQDCPYCDDNVEGGFK